MTSVVNDAQHRQADARGKRVTPRLATLPTQAQCRRMPCSHPSLRKDAGRWVCAACGAVVAAVSSDAPAVGQDVAGAATTAAVGWRERQWFGVSGRGLMVGAATLPLAWLLCWLFPFFNHVLWLFTTLCHEMGHAAGALMVGRPALPAFDFSFGGGVTMTGERRWWLLAMYAIGVVMLWRQAGAQRWLRWTLGIAVGAVALLILTGLDVVWFVWMGYGGELIIATVFLHRALTGVAEVYPGERWLYGLVAWVLLGHALGMCWMLLFDPAFQHTYLMGKRGIDNDLVRLANDLGWSLRSVSWLNLLVGLLVPVAAVIAARLFPREGPRER
jgi:hypothetical protein